MNTLPTPVFDVNQKKNSVKEECCERKLVPRMKSKGKSSKGKEKNKEKKTYTYAHFTNANLLC